MRKNIIITITLMAVMYLIGFIADIPFLSVGKILVGGMLWCIAGIWLALFLLANFVEE